MPRRFWFNACSFVVFLTITLTLSSIVTSKQEAAPIPAYWYVALLACSACFPCTVHFGFMMYLAAIRHDLSQHRGHWRFMMSISVLFIVAALCITLLEQSIVGS